MVRFFFALICVLLLQLSKASSQTNWKYIGMSNDSTKCYVSCDKIVKRINSAVIWVKYLKPHVDSTTEQLETLSSVNKFLHYDEDVCKKIFDFKNDRTKTLSIYWYLNGSVVDQFQANENEAIWTDIIPDTFQDSVFAFLKKYLHMKN